MRNLVFDNEQPNQDTQVTGEVNNAASSVQKQMVIENAVARENPEDRYAHMFADWDLLPPMVMIRRVSRR